MDIGAVQSIFTTLPVDLVASVLFATFITIATLRLGASFAIALSLSLIISGTLFAALPGTFMIGPALSGIGPMAAAGIYSAIVVLLTFILYRATSTLSDDSARPMFAIATGLATTIIVLVMWHATPLASFWTFNPLIQSVFGDPYRLFWLLLAFISFAFVKS